MRDSEPALLRAEIAQLRALLSARDPLALALVEAMRGPFLAADVWALAEEQASEAETEGRALPDLPRAIRQQGLKDANALGRYLSGSPLFEKASSDGGRILWVCRVQ